MPIACASDFVIGVASTISSALPAGGPSRMSVRITSANSMSTIRCAVVEPTNPLPTTVTFFLLIFSPRTLFLATRCQAEHGEEAALAVGRLSRHRHPLHVLNNRSGKRRRPNLCRAGHQPFQV